jgi:2-polyprenyl-6-methoxyphenol hydroxylase-like FAD-dependent oxidoreductase
VAGLTLAHAFDSAGIDYVLLEARDKIAPKLGATIVIQANGARILDQLGIYEPMSNMGVMSKMSSNTLRRSDGSVVNVNEWPRLTEERYVYETMKSIMDC